MIHITKYALLDAGDTLTIPKAAFQIVETPCYHCAKITRFPVPSEYVDWKIIAEDYRLRLEQLTASMDRMIADIDVMQSGANPIREYIANQWAVILEEGRKKFTEDERSEP